MTENELLDSLGEIDDADLELAERPMKTRPAVKWLAAAAAAAAAAFGLFFAVRGVLKNNDKQAANPTAAPTDAATAVPTEAPTETQTAEPTPDPTPTVPTAEPTEYPTAKPSDGRQERLFRGAVSAAYIPEVPHDAASPEYAAYMTAVSENAYGAWHGLEGFFDSTAKEFLLSDGAGENKVYSPLNVYMALAMLAETTSGETRAQILDLLGEESVDGLRARMDSLWLSNYRDDIGAISLPAASAWLNERFAGGLNGATLSRLSKYHHASIFEGDMSNSDYNALYRDWLNEQTRDLLADSVEQMELDPASPIELAASLYFKLDWEEDFDPLLSYEDFFIPSQEEIANFMHGGAESLYCGEGFTMTYKRLCGARMWLVLPDEGLSLERIIESGEALGVILSGNDGLLEFDRTVGINLPEFDVGSDIMLDEGLKRLGVADCFDTENADFSELTDADGVCVSGIRHSVRVKANEKGVEAAAVTITTYSGWNVEEYDVEITLDRPFMFVITGFDGTPLFVGTVYHPAR